MCAKGGGGLLRERMALAARLWDAGVRAELLPAAAPSLTAQYDYARSRGIAWLAILAADTLHAADTVRVRAPAGSLYLRRVACLRERAGSWCTHEVHATIQPLFKSKVLRRRQNQRDLPASRLKAWSGARRRMCQSRSSRATLRPYFRGWQQRGVRRMGQGLGLGLSSLGKRTMSTLRAARTPLMNRHGGGAAIGGSTVLVCFGFGHAIVYQAPLCHFTALLLQLEGRYAADVRPAPTWLYIPPSCACTAAEQFLGQQRSQATYVRVSVHFLMCLLGCVL